MAKNKSENKEVFNNVIIYDKNFDSLISRRLGHAKHLTHIILYFSIGLMIVAALFIIMSVYVVISEEPSKIIITKANGEVMQIRTSKNRQLVINTMKQEQSEESKEEK